MREKKVALRYARAVIGCVETDKEIELMGKELKSFVDVYEGNPDLRKALIHPGIPLESKERVLNGVLEKMDLSEKCREFSMIVLKKGRIDVIHDIEESFSVMADEKLKRVKVNISAAQALTEEEAEKLEKTFSKIAGKTAKLEVTTDKSLIGGIIARIGSKVYDGSISNQLRLMKIKLEQEA